MISPTHKHTICPKSSDSFYKVSYYIKWVTILLGHTVIQSIASTSDLKSVTISDVSGGYVLTCPKKASSAKLNHETSYFFICMCNRKKEVFSGWNNLIIP